MCVGELCKQGKHLGMKMAENHRKCFYHQIEPWNEVPSEGDLGTRATSAVELRD